jgi:hypothetical protein
MPVLRWGKSGDHEFTSVNNSYVVRRGERARRYYDWHVLTGFGVQVGVRRSEAAAKALAQEHQDSGAPLTPR